MAVAVMHDDTGAVRFCPRKGAFAGGLAWARCIQMHDLDSARCEEHNCQHHVQAFVEISTRKRIGNTSHETKNQRSHHSGV